MTSQEPAKEASDDVLTTPATPGAEALPSTEPDEDDTSKG